MSTQVTFTSEELVLIADALRYWCTSLDAKYEWAPPIPHKRAGMHVFRRAEKLANKIDALVEAVNAEPAP